MADVRDPVGVGVDGDGVTSPESRAATGTDVRAAARVLAAGGIGPTVARPRLPAQAIVGGGLLVALLIALVVSVIFVSNSSKHPVVQPIPLPPTTTAAPAASPTVAYGPLPLPPAPVPMLPPPVNIPAPVATVSPSPVIPETVAPASPAPPPKPRLPRLRDLLPRLFPNG